MALRQEHLTGIIIAIVAALLLLAVFFENVKNFGVENTRREICKRQVDINAVSTAMQSAINCPVMNVTIKSDPNSDSTKRRIADIMGDVRYVYDTAWSGGELFEAKSEVFCSVYAIIDFAQKDRTMNDFEKYLATHKYSALSDETYMDYFGKRKGGFSQGVLLPRIVSETKASSNDKYAVLFWYKKQYSGMEEALNTVGNAITNTGPAALPIGIVTVIGGGVLIGAGGTMLIASGIGYGGLTLLGFGATGAIVGGTGTAGFLAYNLTYSENPKYAAQVLFVAYNNQSSLEAIGCKYFPVALGTRPQ
jgi:hypothetical protein